MYAIDELTLCVFLFLPHLRGGCFLKRSSTLPPGRGELSLSTEGITSMH